MSRKRKTPEQQIIEAVSEIGIDKAEWLIKIIKLSKTPDLPQVESNLAGMVKRSLTVPKVKKEKPVANDKANTGTD